MATSLKTPEETPEPLVGLYTMYYRQSAVGNHLITKNFRFNGNLAGARERAEQHCQIINAKLNFVQPLISNLKLEEDHVIGNLRGTSNLGAGFVPPPVIDPRE